MKAIDNQLYENELKTTTTINYNNEIILYLKIMWWRKFDKMCAR